MAFFAKEVDGHAQDPGNVTAADFSGHPMPGATRWPAPLDLIGEQWRRGLGAKSEVTMV